jgi:hypothetical protein
VIQFLINFQFSFLVERAFQKEQGVNLNRNIKLIGKKTLFLKTLGRPAFASRTSSENDFPMMQSLVRAQFMKY